MIEWIVLGLAMMIFVALSLIGWWVGKYNTLQIATQDIKTQWSNVKTEYQRRVDLILNLARTAKGYAKFEKETLTQVAAARAGLNNKSALPKAEQVKNMHMIDNVLSRLMVVVEKYPQLQAVEQFNDLSDELKMTENRINVARTDYNELVRDYNI